MSELLLSERRDLIAEYVDKAKINWAHLCIALLVQAGFVDRVLTTNFDLLVVRACALLNEFPAIYDFAASQLFKSPDIPEQGRRLSPRPSTPGSFSSTPKATSSDILTCWGRCSRTPAAGGSGLSSATAVKTIRCSGSGVPLAILDGGPIAAATNRRRVRRRDGPVRAASVDARGSRRDIGAGVQGRSHLRGRRARAAGVAVARRRSPSGTRGAPREPGAHARVGEAAGAPTARPAVAGADVVVTAVSFRPGELAGPDRRLASRPTRWSWPSTSRRSSPRRWPGRPGVPGRRPRAVPRQPRCRPIHRVSGPGAARWAKRSGGGRATGDGSRPRDPPRASGSPMWCSAMAILREPRPGTRNLLPLGRSAPTEELPLIGRPPIETRRGRASRGAHGGPRRHRRGHDGRVDRARARRAGGSRTLLDASGVGHPAGDVRRRDAHPPRGPRRRRALRPLVARGPRRVAASRGSHRRPAVRRGRARSGSPTGGRLRGALAVDPRSRVGDPGRAAPRPGGRRALAAGRRGRPRVRRVRARGRAAHGAPRRDRRRPGLRRRRAGGSSWRRFAPGEREDGAACGTSSSADGTRNPGGPFVFACGPWLPRLFPDLLGEVIRVTKQDVLFVGPRAGDGRFAAEWQPCSVD